MGQPTTCSGTLIKRQVVHHCLLGAGHKGRHKSEANYVNKPTEYFDWARKGNSWEWGLWIERE